MKKIHKLDLMLIIGIILIPLLSLLIDGFMWKDVEGGFPILTFFSVFASYVLWIILLIYSSFKFKEKQDKPKLVRWFMWLFIPVLHYAILFIISEIIIFLN